MNNNLGRLLAIAGLSSALHLHPEAPMDIPKICDGDADPACIRFVNGYDEAD